MLGVGAESGTSFKLVDGKREQTIATGHDIAMAFLDLMIGWGRAAIPMS